jgi:cytochrome oxidase Cu insertion factor (SCO1/SenC/PrrC family)
MTKGRRYAIAFALGLVLLAVVIVSLFDGESLLARLDPRAVMSSTGAALVGGPFTLVDQDGKTRDDKEFRGKLMLVYFGYTFCPDVCPTTLATMTEALDKLGAKAAKVQPIFITVDPARDTPAVLKRYVANFHPSLIGLTGSAAEIAAAARAYRVYYAKADSAAGADYLMDHSGFIYLMGPDGKYLTLLTPQSDAKEMADRIARFIPG